MTGKPVLSLDHATKRFGDTVAVEDVSLDLREGEFVALLGASGCGKSTTLRLLAGLDQVSAGRVLLRGADATRDTAAARNVALMFQSYALYPHLTVYQNIAMPLRLRRLSVLERLPGAAILRAPVGRKLDAIDAQVRRIAEMLRLDPLLARKPGQLSGGQQQRVALARALVRDPSAFLLDEPLSNLDTQLRADTRDEIRALHKTTGYPFLLVTHDQSDALSMADRVAVMIDGRIVQVGSPESVFKRPGSRAVAAFIGHNRMNMIPSGPAAAVHPMGARFDLGIRPEDLRITPDGALDAFVESAAYHGEESILSLRGPGDIVLRAVLRGAASVPDQGSRIHLSASPEAVHAFDIDGQRVEIA
ncbi:ABC transporter ATP-binding protein [Roseisalinus antarcticus]|uniref:Maltose/maltodextrin import ATP-binding protein MalK n=1 Tax=Roseisalinus antarcticus TaxID=254357 RepID=A0A1Y5TWN2_9RHOB|nr:ABC transporter ATP-binding protein [Roseisalinus antarcticus]SLN75009.1 Maltose/maltodextrin import ATP-binding protein MalK [Roseisalinus antarcticus]